MLPPVWFSLVSMPRVSQELAGAAVGMAVIIPGDEWEQLGTRLVLSSLHAVCLLLHTLCLLYLIGNTVFSCWGGWREGERTVPS